MGRSPTKKVIKLTFDIYDWGAGRSVSERILVVLLDPVVQLWPLGGPSNLFKMEPRFVADGATRLKDSPEYQGKLRALRDFIYARHAGELSSAGFFGRVIIRWRMVREFRRERRGMVPSSQALYATGVAILSIDENTVT